MDDELKAIRERQAKRPHHSSNGLVAHAVADIDTLLRMLDERTEELALWKPLTPEEAKRAYDEAEAVPMSEDEINRIVEAATDPAHSCTNSEQAQMAVRIAALERENAALRQRDAIHRDAMVSIQTFVKMTRDDCGAFLKEEIQKALDHVPWCLEDFNRYAADTQALCDALADNESLERDVAELRDALGSIERNERLRHAMAVRVLAENAELQAERDALRRRERDEPE